MQKSLKNNSIMVSMAAKIFNKWYILGPALLYPNLYKHKFWIQENRIITFFRSITDRLNTNNSKFSVISIHFLWQKRGFTLIFKKIYLCKRPSTLFINLIQVHIFATIYRYRETSCSQRQPFAVLFTESKNKFYKADEYEYINQARLLNG
jgi:hypothetical protein